MGILAYEDKVFFVGCPYNLDTTLTHKITEPLIAFYASNSFGGEAADRVIAAEDMELVFEYGGVLEDSCLVGGTDQKPIKRIPFPKAPSSGDTVKANELFGSDPMEFTRIKEDGDAVLKMYFVRKKTGNGPDTLANDTSDWVVPLSNAWRYPGVNYSFPALYPHPFYNEETGEPSDTFTVRFKIYNQPKFASNIIRSRVYYRGTMRLNYGFVSGTDTKYMVRSLDGGWNWHPADSPLTDVERDLLQDDSVRVCLRELDEGVAWAAYLKKGYLDPVKFPAASNIGTIEGAEFADEYRERYYYNLLNRLTPASIAHAKDEAANYASVPTWDDIDDDSKVGYLEGVFSIVYNGPISHADTVLMLDLAAANYPGDPSSAQVIYYAEAIRDWNTVLGKRKADKVAVPPRCHEETYCFYVKRDAPPVHQRSVFIPTVEGVTVVSPGVGYTSIPSQKNFTFRVKYAGEPMTVTAKRLIDGRTVEVLTGTLNADGEYEYVIRRVMQDLTLEFTKTVANTLVDQPSVWANSGAVRIHAPKETTVRIYSASGVLVKQATVQGDKTVPLSAGLYLVVLSDGTTQKVLVQ